MAKSTNKKRKVIVESNGEAHINASFNNIIISITNCSSVNQYPRLDKKYNKWKNIINSKINFTDDKTLELGPFETMWLSNI